MNNELNRIAQTGNTNKRRRWQNRIDERNKAARHHRQEEEEKEEKRKKRNKRRRKGRKKKKKRRKRRRKQNKKEKEKKREKGSGKKEKRNEKKQEAERYTMGHKRRQKEKHDDWPFNFSPLVLTLANRLVLQDSRLSPCLSVALSLYLCLQALNMCICVFSRAKNIHSSEKFWIFLPWKFGRTREKISETVC